MLQDRFCNLKYVPNFVTSSAIPGGLTRVNGQRKPQREAPNWLELMI
jgi:hypothetical protein